MQEYKIEVVVHGIDNLQEELQAAYDNGAAGMFVLMPQEEGVKIVFEREYSDDAEFIEQRMVTGTTLQRAVCEQLADELEESGAMSLSKVVATLRSNPTVYDDKGLPFSAYIGFVPMQAQATA